MTSNQHIQQKIIYTYGDYIYRPADIIKLAQKLHVNCIISLDPNENHLATEVKNQNILFGDFWNYFRKNFPDVSDKHGRVIYKKALENESVMRGIERIKNGADKGYKILLIDHNAETKESPRYTLIGKYLTPDYTIVHIITPMYLLTQDQLQKKIQERKEKIYKKKIEAAELGTIGEEIAGLYLMQNKFRILDRNWNLHKGCELDIVAVKDNILHFIEVKTRSSDKYGEPQQAINKEKMRNIIRALNKYRYTRGMTTMEYQIDTIAIIYRGPTDYDLNYFPDVHPYPITPNYNLPYRNH